MYYVNDNNQNLGNLGVDFSQIASNALKVGGQAASVAQYAQSPQFGTQVDTVISDVEMYTYASTAMTALSTVAIFGLFLIALHKFVKENRK